MKLLENKRGYEMWMIVTAISSLVLLIVLLIVYSGAFKGNNDAVCKLSVLANAGVRVPGAGVESYKIECEMDTITITMEDLEKGMKLAEITMKDFNKKFPGHEYENPDEPKNQKEWVLNKIIAEELRRWWSNMGSGTLENLFSNWWWWFNCEENEKDSCDGFSERINPLHWGVDESPKFCVIGTRIKFDEEIKKEFPDKIESLTTWTKNNPIPYTDESYYEFLMDDTVKGQGLFEKDYSYSTQEPYAILYTRINKHMLGIFANTVPEALDSLLNWVTGWNPGLAWDTDSFDAMHIKEYSKLSEICTIIAN